MPCGAIVAFFWALFFFILKSSAGVGNTTSSLSEVKAQILYACARAILGLQKADRKAGSYTRAGKSDTLGRPKSDLIRPCPIPRFWHIGQDSIHK